MTLFEIILAIFVITSLFAGYMSIGALTVYYLKIPNRWLRIPAVIFWPMTLVVCFAIMPFMWMYEIFNEKY